MLFAMSGVGWGCVEGMGGNKTERCNIGKGRTFDPTYFSLEKDFLIVWTFEGICKAINIVCARRCEVAFTSVEAFVLDMLFAVVDDESVESLSVIPTICQ